MNFCTFSKTSGDGLVRPAGIESEPLMNPSTCSNSCGDGPCRTGEGPSKHLMKKAQGTRHDASPESSAV